MTSYSEIPVIIKWMGLVNITSKIWHTELRLERMTILIWIEIIVSYDQGGNSHRKLPSIGLKR